MKNKIIIGTRSSKLALWQANKVKDELNKHFHKLEINLKEIKTKGDHITDVALSKIGGKGLFTKEIEDALLKKEIDLATHSLKDLPTKLPDGLKIGAILKREDPHDILISRNKTTFKNLPSASKVGTSSLRRLSQLKALRQDLEYLDLRGNLDTRIKKLEEGQYDAIVLAYAGVKRLGFEDKISYHFSPKEILPAVGQGALAVEIRENDKEIENLILKLNDEESYLISLAERTFLGTLQGGCQVPIGIYSEVKNNKIILYGMIASLDGKRIVKDDISTNVILNEVKDPITKKDSSPLAQNDIINKSKKVGAELAHKLLQNGGSEILKEIAPVRQNLTSINV